MTTTTTTTNGRAWSADASDDAAQIVEAFLQAWSAALAVRDAAAIADLFDDEVLFLATAPAPLCGRAQVRAYYEAAPVGLQVRATLVCASRPHADGVHGLADVNFEAPDGVALTGRLGLTLFRRAAGWRVTAYQLSASARPGRP